MKKIIIVIACILCNSFLFAESEYSLKEYLKTNILKLDPIEGEYNVSLHQYLTPSAGEGSSWKINPTYYIKKEHDSFVVYNNKGEETLFQISRIGDTNAYLLTFNHYAYGFEKHQFVLQNGIMFEINHEFTPSTVKRQINNIHNIPLSRIHSYFNMRGIKSYPTSSMYLEAAKEDARKAELEYQQALEEAQRKAGWSGTGFALYQGHIVTNYHVVEDAKTIFIKGVKGDFNTEYRAKVIATDKTNDLAVLKIDDEKFSSFGTIPYKIKKSMSDVGESVWALGYPMTSVMGDEIKFTDGKISSRTGIQGDMSVYQISVPIQPGNSGGPLFDNYGNIVGITSSGLNREEFNSENVNYAIKTSYLYNLIESTITTSILPQGTAMQGQALTQKIKLAKNFVFMVLCSSDPNFHSEHTENIQQKEIVTEIQSSSNILINNTTQKESIPYVISNPIYNHTSDLEISKITLDSTCTILDCKWMNCEYYSGICSIRKETYIQTPDSSAKFKLLQVKGIAYYPNQTKVPYQQSVFFSLYFEALPQGTKKFDLIEPDGWKVLDIFIE
jgi:S1-C subfamily serine protease